MGVYVVVGTNGQECDSRLAIVMFVIKEFVKLFGGLRVFESLPEAIAR